MGCPHRVHISVLERPRPGVAQHRGAGRIELDVEDFRGVHGPKLPGPVRSPLHTPALGSRFEGVIDAEGGEPILPARTGSGTRLLDGELREDG